MTRVPIAEEIAEQIRNGEGPIELVDEQGQTVGVVTRPPSPTEIERARSRASLGEQRLSWAQLVAKVKAGVSE